MNKAWRLSVTQLALAMAASSAVPAYAVDWAATSAPARGDQERRLARVLRLSGAGLKYRLGNECDFYGEFLLSQGFKTEGVEYKANLMTNLYNPAPTPAVQA